jgi:hypothetical protein
MPIDRHQGRRGRGFKQWRGTLARKAIALITTTFVVSTISTVALAQSKQTTATATRDVRQLVQMMDKDKDGTVSKDEFLQFMGQVFDRADVNKNGKLEPEELQQTSIPRAVRRDCIHRTFPECSGS